MQIPRIIADDTVYIETLGDTERLMFDEDELVDDGFENNDVNGYEFILTGENLEKEGKFYVTFSDGVRAMRMKRMIRMMQTQVWLNALSGSWMKTRWSQRMMMLLI